ncbi:neurofilament heavy polypeptide-like [Schistocerca americana]|uniref:neurofilament heavy polypeptide-like n=1 Tax=Schistocerca americana TaxID=7009 RepID=UPI001F4F72FE|nr:neurofilament heavy polypeptide-like [Schistocerca americana]
MSFSNITELLASVVVVVVVVVAAAASAEVANRHQTSTVEHVEQVEALAAATTATELAASVDDRAAAVRPSYAVTIAISDTEGRQTELRERIQSCNDVGTEQPSWDSQRHEVPQESTKSPTEVDKQLDLPRDAQGERAERLSRDGDAGVRNPVVHHPEMQGGQTPEPQPTDAEVKEPPTEALREINARNSETTTEPLSPLSSSTEPPEHSPDLSPTGSLRRRKKSKKRRLAHQAAESLAPALREKLKYLQNKDKKAEDLEPPGTTGHPDRKERQEDPGVNIAHRKLGSRPKFQEVVHCQVNTHQQHQSIGRTMTQNSVSITWTVTQVKKKTYFINRVGKIALRLNEGLMTTDRLHMKTPVVAVTPAETSAPAVASDVVTAEQMVVVLPTPSPPADDAKSPRRRHRRKKATQEQQAEEDGVMRPPPESSSETESQASSRPSRLSSSAAAAAAAPPPLWEAPITDIDRPSDSEILPPKPGLPVADFPPFPSKPVTDTPASKSDVQLLSHKRRRTCDDDSPDEDLQELEHDVPKEMPVTVTDSSFSEPSHAAVDAAAIDVIPSDVQAALAPQQPSTPPEVATSPQAESQQARAPDKHNEEGSTCVQTEGSQRPSANKHEVRDSDNKQTCPKEEIECRPPSESVLSAHQLAEASHHVMDSEVTQDPPTPPSADVFPSRARSRTKFQPNVNAVRKKNKPNDTQVTVRDPPDNAAHSEVSMTL